jgi:tripartite-type tricarboxylate transporter receptor subunit TctC
VPTAQELGYDVTWANPNWWLGPPGMPQEIVDQLADVLEQAMGDPEIQAYFAENALDAYWTPGDEAAADAQSMLESLKGIAVTIQ